MLEQKIDHIIRPALNHEGYEVVCVRVTGQTRFTVQVFIERQDKEPISLDDCSAASPLISALLDVDDPIQGAYTLEVSSPGLERPLWRLEDYKIFCGHTIKCQLSTLIEGQKRFIGTLQNVQGEDIVLAIHQEDQYDRLVSIPYAQIQKAHLVVQS